MGKYFSLGEYNNQYKYIWIYLIVRLVSLLIYDNELIVKQFQKDIFNLPYYPFISIQFEYLGFILIAIIIMLIQMIFTCHNCVKKGTNGKYHLIYFKRDFSVKKRDYFLFVNLFFVVVADMIEDILYKFDKIDWSLLEYWMFEMLFFELFFCKIMKAKLYKHHIYSLIFILTSCSLIQTIIIILTFINGSENEELANNKTWMIPTGLIVFLLNYIFKAYVYCVEKYYLDKTSFPIVNYLFCYGVIGFITSIICAIISSYAPCGDTTLPEFSKKICNYNDDNDIYYFSCYKLYFKDLTSDYFGLRIILMIAQTGLYFFSNYYIYAIYKTLSPIYHICMKRLDYLFLNILAFIEDLISKKNDGINIYISILDILILIFYILGSLVYLEFVELNFCDLNYSLRRKITERSINDIKLSFQDYDINSDISSNQTDD